LLQAFDSDPDRIKMGQLKMGIISIVGSVSKIKLRAIKKRIKPGARRTKKS
jgi:hypothetical protein